MRSSIPVAVTRMSSSMRTWRKEREEEEGGIRGKGGRVVAMNECLGLAVETILGYHCPASLGCWIKFVCGASM